MRLSARIGLVSYQAQFLVALLASLLAAFAVVAAINVYYHRQVANEHARELAQQALRRIEAAVAAVVETASERAELVRVRAQGARERPDLVALLAEQAPAFVGRTTLSFVGVGMAADGEYAMLERIEGSRVRLRHFVVHPDGTHAIHDRWVDDLGRPGAVEVSPWNGYDPRTRPFFVAGTNARRAVWTDSYLFYDNAQRPAAIGMTLAVPWYAAEGALVGVIDVDFDTRSLSEYLAGLQRELPGPSFLVERRRDGTQRVVAHTDFADRPGMREGDLEGDPLAQAVLARLPATWTREPGTLRLEVAGEDYVAVHGAVSGKTAPAWLAVVALPRRVAVGALNRIQAVATGALVLAALAGFALAGVVARRVTRPLARLAAEVGGATTVEARLTETGPAEVALLARRFNELADRIGSRQAELATAEREAQGRAARLAEQTAALAEIAQVLKSDALLEPSVRRVSEVAAKALVAAQSSVWLIDPGTDVLRQVDVFTVTTAEHRIGIEIARGKYATVLERFAARRCVVVAGADRDFAGQGEPSKSGRGSSVLVAALHTHRKVVGLVTFATDDSARIWTAEDELFAAAVADILSLHLETRARRAAEEEISRRSERLARLSRAVGRAASCADVRAGRLDRAFAELTEVCVDGMQATQASIWTFDPAKTRLVLNDLFRADRAEHSRGAVLPIQGHERYFKALREDRFVAAADARTDPRTSELLDHYLVPNGLYAMFDAPVRSRGELVGVVCVEQAVAPRVWTEEEEIFCGAIADLASLAVESAARQRAEVEIGTSRERLRLHIEGTPLGAIDWNHDLRVIGWNPAAERIFGYDREMAFGRDGFFLVPEKLRPRLAEVAQQLLTGRANSIERFENVRADGRAIFCDWRNTALTDEAGRVIGITSLVEDVTERVRAEAEIRALNSGLEERVAGRTAELAAANEKLKELDRLKSEFLATMSHELRTPLNSIIGFTGLLKEGLAGPVNDEQRKQLGMVYSSSRHLLSLINDLLDLSRIEAGRVQIEAREFAPIDVLREVADSLGPMARLKELAVVVDDAEADTVLKSDRKRFMQIVVNLANNALKFTERGGVRLALSGDADRLWVRVTDTGPGIPADSVDSLFEAFRQIDGSSQRVHEGTGLGLYLCRKLVRLLGGEIGVETEFGRGATFWFWVPRDGPLYVGSRALWSRMKPRVLLVEDNPANVYLATFLLTRHGFEVEHVGDGLGCLERVRAARPDVVLMDLQIPRLNGYEAARELLADPVTAVVPIVAVTAYAMPGDRAKALALGFRDYIEKPYDPITFAAQVAAHLNPKSPADPRAP